MFTLEVLKVEKLFSQADNSDILNVEAQILDEDGKEVEVRKLGFPISLTEDEVKEELQKFINTYNLEVRQKEANAEHDAEQANADEVIEALTGESFSETIKE